MNTSLSKPGPRTAVVIGGSLAGLLTGRALANHCDRVLIIERDFYPNVPGPRPELPQSFFLHVLLLRGQHIFEQFFPGLRNELINAGAPELSSGSDITVFTAAGWGAPFDTGIKALSCSRDLLDWTVRRRLTALPNVEFVQGAVVTRRLPTTDRSGVAGVMTVAAMEADLLNRYMQQHLDLSQRGYTRRLQRYLARAHQIAWRFATFQDYRFPTATEAPGWTVKLSNWYFDRLSKLITTDADAHRKLVDVMHLLQPPGTLFSPRLVARVIRTI